MNRKTLIALAAFAAAVASTGVRAESPDAASQYAPQFEGNRTRAEVQAEASRVSATRSIEPAGSRVAARVQSNAERGAVRAEAAQALRAGLIRSGEAS